ncbi:MAG: hypothetical protein J1E00_05715 [Oscillospiraceae bacterium]|nr:hypothetical protein [Oscillospiraceae bacterium]
MVKQHIKSICAATGYTFVFYVGCWGLRRCLISWNFIDAVAVFVLFAIMLPLYFFVKNRMEKRWTLRGALVLSSALLFCVAWVVTDGGASEPLFSYFCFLEGVHIGILLLDLLGEALRLLTRKLRNVPRPAWICCASSGKKAVFSALFYLLLFYTSSVFYIVSREIFDDFLVLDISFDYFFCLYIGVQSLLYFSVRRRVEGRWPFRGIVLLIWHCFVILHVIVFQFIPADVRASSILNQLNNFTLYAYFIIAVFLLLDLLTELLQEVYRLFLHSKRRIQNRRA